MVLCILHTSPGIQIGFKVSRIAASRAISEGELRFKCELCDCTWLDESFTDG